MMALQMSPMHRGMQGPACASSHAAGHHEAKPCYSMVDMLMHVDKECKLAR